MNRALEFNYKRTYASILNIVFKIKLFLSQYIAVSHNIYMGKLLPEKREGRSEEVPEGVAVNTPQHRRELKQLQAHAQR